MLAAQRSISCEAAGASTHAAGLVVDGHHLRETVPLSALEALGILQQDRDMVCHAMEGVICG